jgi:hypothetical protein
MTHDGRYKFFFYSIESKKYLQQVNVEVYGGKKYLMQAAILSARIQSIGRFGEVLIRFSTNIINVPNATVIDSNVLQVIAVHS